MSAKFRSLSHNFLNVSVVMQTWKRYEVDVKYENGKPEIRGVAYMLGVFYALLLQYPYHGNGKFLKTEH